MVLSRLLSTVVMIVIIGIIPIGIIGKRSASS